MQKTYHQKKNAGFLSMAWPMTLLSVAHVCQITKISMDRLINEEVIPPDKKSLQLLCGQYPLSSSML